MSLGVLRGGLTNIDTFQLEAIISAIQDNLKDVASSKRPPAQSWVIEAVYEWSSQTWPLLMKGLLAQ